MTGISVSPGERCNYSNSKFFNANCSEYLMPPPATTQQIILEEEWAGSPQPPMKHSWVVLKLQLHFVQSLGFGMASK